MRSRYWWPVLAAILALGASSLVGAANPTATWGRAIRAVLPSGASGLPQGYLPTLACPAAGDCVAAGLYADATGAPRGLVLTESAGRWLAPRTIAAPAGAAAHPGLTPSAVACAAVGWCAVVGSYQSASGTTLAFTWSESAGRWGTTREAPLPANAATAGQLAQLHEVACPAVGHCVAVGTYVTTRGATSGLALAQASATWASPTPLPAPAGANLSSLLSVTQVACAAVGSCSAIGTYLDINNVQHGIVVSEVAGQWGAVQSVLPPPDASEYAHVTLSALACPSAGTCWVVGTYYDHAGASELLDLRIDQGRALPASAIAAPAGAAANPRAFYYGYIALACASSTSCAAGGQYVDQAGRYQGFLVDAAAGQWGRAQRLSLPPGAVQVGHNGGVVALSCPQVNACRAGAAYEDATGRYQALVVSQVDGRWRAGSRVALPAGGTSVGIDGGVYALVCPAPSSCTAVGSYLVGVTRYEGFLVSTS
ncbi:MAG: hypothetical protein ACP5OV_08415 [Acidimicrobiales bacterium]